MKILTNSAAGDKDYWALTSDDRLAIATWITPNPASPQVLDMVAKPYQEHLLEIDQIFAAGGHCLELGCGAASALLSYLQIHPKLTAVGVELAADLVALARQRALDLGKSTSQQTGCRPEKAENTRYERFICAEICVQIQAHVRFLRPSPHHRRRHQSVFFQ